MEREAWTIGGDPGTHAGLSLVRASRGLGGVYHQQVVGAWHITGSSDALWYRRARLVHKQLAELLPAASEPALYWIEQPPPTFRQGSLGRGNGHRGVKDGHAAWAGLGRHLGLLLAAAFEQGFSPFCVQQSVWAGHWGRLIRRSKSANDPTHRIDEASRLLGARALLEAIPAGSRVDVAEACLIAGAAALHLLQAGSAELAQAGHSPWESP